MAHMESLGKRYRFWIFCSVVLSAVIGGVLMLLWPYNIRSFRGDGGIQDTGFWSYPRYHIRFSEVRLDKNGEFGFACDGLPPVPMSFQLSLRGDHEYDALKQLETHVEFRMTDDQGTEICRASGPLKEWVLRWGGSQDIGGFWQPTAREFQVKRTRSYKLKLSIKDAAPDSPVILARPILEGGGNELP